MLETATISSEQINSLPFLLGVLEDLGIRQIIDEHLHPHGHWQGISPGTAITIWLAHILQTHDHRLLTVRDWAAQQHHTINSLLGISLRDTDCTDDRLANILSMLAPATVQAKLDHALTQSWLRVYHLPRQVVRLDSTSVTVHHDPADPTSLFQLGVSKDHRPDLKQFKIMLATLDPLGLPLACQTLPGNASDDKLYIPAYDAAVQALGTNELLVVGDSKMGALATRGHIVAHGSSYLCTYNPPAAASQIGKWIAAALQRREHWQTLDSVDKKTGELRTGFEIYPFTREQSWREPTTQQEVRWYERVLLVRSRNYAAGLRRIRERVLTRLSDELLRWSNPPLRGRKKYHNREELAALVAQRITAAGMTGLVEASLVEQQLPNGTSRWVVESIWVVRAAWQALLESLGWQVYLTNGSEQQLNEEQIVDAYHGQAVHERGFSRLKSRNLHIRPVYLRDEERIAGLVWLLMLGLRVLTLVEQRIRESLATEQGELVGLNPASRRQGTSRPTTERLIAAFAPVTLTTVQQAGTTYRHVTPLNHTQREILRLLRLPLDLYDRLVQPQPNSLLHLRE